MNDRRKIPDGHREKSSRSRLSRSCALIFVVAATAAREILRPSRSARSRRPGLSVTLAAVLVLLHPLPADSDARKVVGGGAGSAVSHYSGDGTDGRTGRDNRKNVVHQ
jgi:hypothetical protein